jgi:hypothetical protein
MPFHVLVLPSPLLPAEAYESLVDALRQVTVGGELADASGATSGSQLIERWTQLVRSSDPAALVAHSNAGNLAPVVRANTDAALPIVFMDAALPPERGPVRLAPPAFRRTLGTLVQDDGLLPPWTRWWPEESMDEVIPPELFERIDESGPRLSLDYFDSEVTAPEGWTGRANAYLAFGETYAREIAFARAQGWPTVVEEGLHLQFLWQPEAVAGMVSDLANRVAPE